MHVSVLRRIARCKYTEEENYHIESTFKIKMSYHFCDWQYRKCLTKRHLARIRRRLRKPVRLFVLLWGTVGFWFTTLYIRLSLDMPPQETTYIELPPNYSIMSGNNNFRQTADASESATDILDSPLTLWNETVLFKTSFYSFDKSISPNKLFKNGKSLMKIAIDENSIMFKNFVVETKENEVRLAYPPYTTRDPLFVSEEDQRVFWKNDLSRGASGNTSDPKLLTGVVKLIKGGRYSSLVNCGWKTNLTEFVNQKYEEDANEKDRRVHCPILVPESYSFQHFLDGTVPKLVQALPFLLQENVTVILYNYYRNAIIPQILHKLGIKNVILQKRSKYLQYVDNQLNTCVTPPLHPLLRQTFHHLVGAPRQLEVPKNQSKVILLSRKVASNGGRHITNRRAVEKFLSDRYGERFHNFNGQYDLERALNIFGKAEIIIGIHGGAFYNLNFSPRNTKIVEVVPLWNGTYPSRLAHNIVWKMADALDQQYWRLSERSVNHHHDLPIDIGKLQKVLDTIDND